MPCSAQPARPRWRSTTRYHSATRLRSRALAHWGRDGRDAYSCLQLGICVLPACLTMISTLFGSCMTLRTGTARLLLCRPVSTHSRLAKWCLSLACLHGTFLARGHQHVDFRYAYGSVTYFGRAFQEWIPQLLRPCRGCPPTHTTCGPAASQSRDWLAEHGFQKWRRGYVGDAEPGPASSHAGAALSAGCRPDDT